MRVLFQGAGAIGIAGAALLTDAHEVAVVSRVAGPDMQAAFPWRVSVLDPTDSDRPEAGPGRCEGENGRAIGRHAGNGDGWSVTRVATTRRVTITSRAEAAAAGRWDLIVLTTRPGDLDPEVASAIRDIAPAFIATTSQVEGDLERTRAEFPDAEVVVFGPAFLSERLEAGREVRFWAPAGAPRFLVAGPRNAVRSLARGLGRLALPVPMATVVLPPTVFIPFVAELSVHDGNWAALKSHLGRPSKAASEAVRGRLGAPISVFGFAARFVLEALERTVPIDVTQYAGRHFARHRGQTRDMLSGWALSAGGADSAVALRELIAALDESFD